MFTYDCHSNAITVHFAIDALNIDKNSMNYSRFSSPQTNVNRRFSTRFLIIISQSLPSMKCLPLTVLNVQFRYARNGIVRWLAFKILEAWEAKKSKLVKRKSIWTKSRGSLPLHCRLKMIFFVCSLSSLRTEWKKKVAKNEKFICFWHKWKLLSSPSVEPFVRQNEWIKLMKKCKKNERKVMKWLLIYEESNDSLFISTLHECLPFTSRFIGWTLAIVEYYSVQWIEIIWASTCVCECLCLCVDARWLQFHVIKMKYDIDSDKIFCIQTNKQTNEIPFEFGWIWSVLLRTAVSW